MSAKPCRIPNLLQNPNKTRPADGSARGGSYDKQIHRFGWHHAR